MTAEMLEKQADWFDEVFGERVKQERVYTADEVTVSFNRHPTTTIKLCRDDYVETIPVEDVDRIPWGTCPRCGRTGPCGVICRDCSP